MTDNQPKDQPPFDEPSVLDYFKSLFRFGGETDLQLPDSDQQLALAISPKSPSP